MKYKSKHKLIVLAFSFAKTQESSINYHRKQKENDNDIIINKDNNILL